MNRKRVRRLYRPDGLQVRMRVRRRKHMALHRGPAPMLVGPLEWWSMDFVHDALADGRPFQILTVDQWSRSSPLLEVASRMSGRSVGEALNRVLAAAARARARSRWITALTFSRGRLKIGRIKGGRGASIFIRSGKPVENAFIESFNGRLRGECLNVHQFTSQAKIQAWRLDYDQRRPHGSLGHLTPNEFVTQRRAMRPAEAVAISS